MPISLPQEPDGHQYEDLVAATLRVQGHFIESKVTLRDNNKEVLELDVVATPAGAPIADRTLYEAKKSGIHFADLFKLFGQRTYLEIPRACLVSLEGPETQYLPIYEAKGDELGVHVRQYAIQSKPTDLAASCNALTDEQRDHLVAAAWYQQIAQRTAIGALLNECKSRAGTAVCDHARQYLFNVRASFFQKEPLARAEALYNAYFAHPKLAGDAVTLMAAQDGVSPISAAWGRVNEEPNWLWVQAIMYLESSARLSIVKNALDDFLTRGSAPPPHRTLKLGSLSLEFPLHALPESFHSGLAKIRDHPYGARIPYLFQAFFDLLGGFILYRDSRDLELVEALTGVPSNEVISALRLIDRFFAPENGSMLFEQGGELLCLKMTPAFVRGCGAFARKVLFDIADYNQHSPKMGWLLGRWHNAAYAILEPVLNRPIRAGAVHPKRTSTASPRASAKRN